MNWKGPGRKRPWPNWRYYSGIELTTQNNHEKSGAGAPVEVLYEMDSSGE